MNHAQVVEFLDARITTTSPPKRKPRRSIKILGVLILVSCAVLASAELIQYFGRIQTTITVEPLILVDGQSGMIIQETFSCRAGNTTNKTHVVTNFHETLWLEIFFNVSMDPGLNVTIFDEEGNPDTVFWIPPLTAYTFNFSYTVLRYADPEVPLCATISIEYT